MKTVFAALVLFFPMLSFGCSFPDGYKTFIPLPQPRLQNQIRKILPPEASYSILQRGFYDGDSASCSDAGIIEFVISNHKAQPKVGYYIELIEGEYDEMAFQAGYYQPIEFDQKSVIRFLWLDGSSGKQEEINMTFAFKSVTSDGHESSSIRVKVTDAGR